MGYTVYHDALFHAEQYVFSLLQTTGADAMTDPGKRGDKSPPPWHIKIGLALCFLLYNNLHTLRIGSKTFIVLYDVSPLPLACPRKMLDSPLRLGLCRHPRCIYRRLQS